MNMSMIKKESNIVELASVYPKNQKDAFVQICRDKYGNFPSCVRMVNEKGVMILDESDKNSKNIRTLIPENLEIRLYHGMTLNLDDERDRNIYECLSNCEIIVPDRDSRDANGVLLIDGEKPTDYNDFKTTSLACFYWLNRTKAAENKINSEKIKFNALKYIFDSTDIHNKSVCKLLGINMDNFPDVSVREFLLQEAKTKPQVIINLYSDPNFKVRLLIEDAIVKKIILNKNGLYYYSEIMLGFDKDAVLKFLKHEDNETVYDRLKKEVWPGSYYSEDFDKK